MHHSQAAPLSTFAFTSAILLGLLTTSCDIIDDQTMVLPSSPEWASVNPAPIARDFQANNTRQTVLMAVIDTGVDYNHPTLKDNIRFRLDASGKPLGTGYDFVANDNWPAPYVARTSRRYQIPADASQPQLLSYQSQFAHFVWSEISAVYPAFLSFADPMRAIVEEIEATTIHGTHVAGLMAYDRSDFGLLPYRVLPLGDISHFKTIDIGEVDPNIFFVEKLEAAIDLAAKEGARIINLSLGAAFTIDNTPEYTKGKILGERIKAAMLKHPNILFVSATGNESGWMDGVSRTSFPCGLEVSNQLCVGAVREDDLVAPFSNIPLQNVDLVFALGVEVLSTVPTGYCPVAAEFEKEVLKPLALRHVEINGDKTPTLPVPAFSNESEKGAILKAAEEILPRCANLTKPLTNLSGTSMATPLVSHIAGEILADNPNFLPQQVIAELKARAKPSAIGKLPISILRIKKPSWYKPDVTPLKGLKLMDIKLVQTESFERKSILATKLH